MREQTDKDRQILLVQCTNQLLESFDAVQILVSRVEDGQTCSLVWGGGNWHTRLGLCREMVQGHEADLQARAIAARITRQPPDDEEDQTADIPD